MHRGFELELTCLACGPAAHTRVKRKQAPCDITLGRHISVCKIALRLVEIATSRASLARPIYHKHTDPRRATMNDLLVDIWRQKYSPRARGIHDRHFRHCLNQDFEVRDYIIGDFSHSSELCRHASNIGSQASIAGIR